MEHLRRRDVRAAVPAQHVVLHVGQTQLQRDVAELPVLLRTEVPADAADAAAETGR